jgi:predicted esterase
MIIVFWIALIGILVALGVVMASIIKTLKKPRWGIVPTDTLAKSEDRIEARGKTYRGFMYSSHDFDESPPMPGMIVLSPRGEKYPGFEHWAAIFAVQGFITLAVEFKDAKSTSHDFMESTCAAFPAFKDALLKNARVDQSKIGLLGFGESALAGLYAGSTDENIKAICCAGMPRVDMARVTGAKGKVFLAHCKDDEVVPLEDFTYNKDVLGTSSSENLLLELGGHDFISQEAVIAGFFSIPINRKLQPAYKQFTPEGVIIP